MARKITMEFYIEDPIDDDTNEVAELHGIEREYNRLKDNIGKVFSMEEAMFEISTVETQRVI